MAAPDGLLDTNILVYAFTTDPRCATAEKLLAKGCLVSVQGLNEFANVAHRKLGMSWSEIGDALTIIRTLCPRILPLDVETHAEAVAQAGRHGLSFYDALVIAAALRANCATLWSEDMQHGRIIDGRLRILNPFAVE
ncbi:PIN domain-containing protein [Aminobacter aganoensis]|uniref:Ribonuclease VapC n=1 Tax=Aminobacter aganoensis TaxID=83264 RepID=A0A7X0KMJ6_9HYPH|nr:PIN domain-containing protein [Aminobacter aganoensis]MBB6356143.1 putative nucleic acid-binding protein [Aminobacter aganoensis]